MATALEGFFGMTLAMENAVVFSIKIIRRGVCYFLCEVSVL
jgi:hypothetical protein